MMNLEEMIGQKVTVEAYLRYKLPTHYNFKYKMLLGDVFINGVYFRDHTFVKYSKRWCFVSLGSTVRFTAIVTKYRHKGQWKIGLRHVRDLHVLTLGTTNPSQELEAA